MNTTYTIAQIKAAAKNEGVTITPAKATLNGNKAYKVSDSHALWKKDDLIRRFINEAY